MKTKIKNVCDKVLQKTELDNADKKLLRTPAAKKEILKLRRKDTK